MKRLTTPKLSFALPFDRSIIKCARVSFKQKDEIVLVKQNDDLRWEENTITIKLTQEETRKLTPCLLKMEVHIITTGGDSLVSKPITVSVDDVLNDEVLE